MPSRVLCLVFGISLAGPPAHVLAQVTTAQSDNSRTGAYLHETKLTPSSVTAARFGKLFSRTVDGDVFAQSLYLPALQIPKVGKRDVIVVATEHDSVYAFDMNGDTDEPLWHASFLDPGKDVTTVPSRDVHCPFIQPEVGITPTPVIDATSGTLYVLARTKESGAYVQKLHALDLTSGAERFGGPVVIKATVKGTGAGSARGEIAFDPLRENPRAALLLTGGEVYLTWASSCDVGPYHGWVMAYDAHDLTQTAVLNVTPGGEQGGIWQSDAGPAADTEGNVYLATGNGTFTAASGGGDYGDSVLKLHLGQGILKVIDYFTPFNQAELNASDLDLGSQGPVLLPDQPGAHPHILVVAGKEGKLYAIDRDRMGKFHAGSDDQVIQTLDLGGGGYGAAAYWNGRVYYTDMSYTTREFTVENGRLTLKGTTGRMAAPGATPSVSADGAQSAIVWVLATKEWNEGSIDKPAVLHAYEAGNVEHELYNSELMRERDRAGMTVRFAIPTIADGRVIVGARKRVDVYGLLPTGQPTR